MRKIDSIIVTILTSLVFALIGVVAADIFWENDKFLMIIFIALLPLSSLYKAN